MSPTAPLVAQQSLFGLGIPSCDEQFALIRRTELSRGAWIEHQAGWLSGHQSLFDLLLDRVEWEHQQRPMYDRIVDVPRLIGSLPVAAQRGELGVVAAMGEALGHRYGTEFSRIGVGLYRNGRDSVAWHGDQVARDLPQAMVATVSLGEPRTFSLRPRRLDGVDVVDADDARNGASRRFRLGHGDLIVMGGTCQRTWEHAVPKVARAGPRIALMFRPVWTGPS